MISCFLSGQIKKTASVSALCGFLPYDCLLNYSIHALCLQGFSLERGVPAARTPLCKRLYKISH